MSNTPTGQAPTLTQRVAEEIRAMMGRRRLTGARLARQLGVSDMWVSYRLRGVQPIDLDDLERIAAALDVSVVDLLPREIRSQTTVPNVEVSNRPRDNRPNGGPGRGGVTPTTRRPVPFDSSALLLPAN